MSKSRVLIVEDEALVALELEHRLGQQGYVIAGTAGTADDALSIVEAQSVDLVLLDVRLGGKRDGIAVASELHKRGIPFVFITAHGDDATLARVKAVQPQGYLLKPFDERLLRLTIETALHRHEFERTRLAAERAQRSDEHLHATIFRHSPLGVLVVSLDAEILLANDAATHLFSLDERRIPRIDTLLPTLRDPALRAVGSEHRIHQHIEGYRSDGTLLHVELSCVSVLVDGTERVILFVRDEAASLARE